MTGPHFRYEEEVMYPALVEIFGQKYVDKLYADHNRVIGSAERLVQLIGKDTWSGEAVEEGLELVRGMLPHVSDCDGLSIMVERLPEATVQSILDARERCNTAGLDLLRWAKELRKRPIPTVT
ncbi:MAG: hemerythrin domain-containing protein [Acidobacteria bacterium]|nr:hemerythrin domain-containing protein [Acidobacteriota bacterium]